MIILKITGYTKSLLAVIIALVATLFAFAWFSKQGKTLTKLNHESDELRRNFATTREILATVSKMEKGLEEVDRELQMLKNEYVLKSKNQGSIMPLLLDTAVGCKVKVNNATEKIIKNPVTELKNAGISLDVSTCEVSLSGTYVSVVRFFQELSRSGIFRIRSLNITANETTEQTGVVTANMVIEGLLIGESIM
jgi:Tfp pilus assembly protein PilO